MSSTTHNTAPTTFAKAAGSEYAYRRFGTPAGTPLLMLQAFRGNLDSWDPALTDALAAGREVILCAVLAVVKNALDFLGREADGKPASILSYSDTDHGGNIAGHELRLVLNKLGMLPLPKSLPLAHAGQLLDLDGALVAESGFGRKAAQFLPWSLHELVRYAEALQPLRQEKALA